MDGKKRNECCCESERNDRERKIREREPKPEPGKSHSKREGKEETVRQLLETRSIWDAQTHSRVSFCSHFKEEEIYVEDISSRVKYSIKLT